MLWFYNIYIYRDVNCANLCLGQFYSPAAISRTIDNWKLLANAQSPTRELVAICISLYLQLFLFLQKKNEYHIRISTYVSIYNVSSYISPQKLFKKRRETKKYELTSKKIYKFKKNSRVNK